MIIEIISLILVMVNAEDSDLANVNPVIHLNYDRNDNYTAMRDKPLDIVIEKDHLRYIWCADKYKNANMKYEPFVPETKLDTVQRITIPNVTNEMSTRWGCTILQDYHGSRPLYYNGNPYTATDVHFHLHVKGAKPVILTANNRTLTYTVTNLTVDYDGNAQYTYEDGEDIFFNCTRPQDESFGKLLMEYFNSEGTLLFKTYEQDTEHIFRSVLKSENNNYYLDCIFNARYHNKEYRYRTTFFIKERSGPVEHAIILSINGQKLPTFSDDENLYMDDYGSYRYLDGEVLNVTCQNIDNNIKGNLIFYFDGRFSDKIKTIEFKDTILVILNTSEINIHKKTLICGINNTAVSKSQAQLYFLSDLPEIGVRILGLPRNNILYQYTNEYPNGKHYWTVEYQYAVNDTLNLRCLSKIGMSGNGWFQWRINGATINSTTTVLPTTVVISNQISTKVLDGTYNGSTIKCALNIQPKLYYNTEIILRLKSEQFSHLDSDKMISDIKGFDLWVIIPTVCIGVIIAIITMVCLVYRRKRTKHTSLIQNAYENLSNQNDSPIPAFPNQWELNDDDSHYTKIDEGVYQDNCTYATDKMYSVPYKRQSNISENHYTEIDDYFMSKCHGIATNRNSAQADKNKGKDMLHGSFSKKLNNASYSNYKSDYNEGNGSKLSDYDKLRHNNLPMDKDFNSTNEAYANIQRISDSKNKNVRFRQDCLKPIRNNSEESRKDIKTKNPGFNQYDKSEYANTSNDNIFNKEKGLVRNIPNFENNFVKNDDNTDIEYAEPYAELEVSCKNDLYGL